MKREKLLFLFLFLVLLSFQGCQMDPCGSAPADMIENMEDLVNEVAKLDYKVESSQCETYDNRFKTLYEDCYEGWRTEMTFQQKRDFAGLVTRYVTNRFGRSFFRSIFGKDNKKSDKGEPFFDELEKDLEKFIEENKEWFDEL